MPTWRSTGRPRRSGGRIEDSGGVCLIHGNHPSWAIANNAFRTDPKVPASQAIERVVGSFRALGRRPVMMTLARLDGDLEAALGAAGWKLVLDLPIMVRPMPLPDQPVDGAGLRWLDAGLPGDLATFRDILHRGFAEDDEEREVLDSLFAGPSSIARPDEAGAVIALLDGAPAASAMVYRVGDGAAVGWVATVPEARRRGLGRLVTAAATNRGFELGAAWATLQASPMGLPLYRSMGFETVSMSRIWLAPAQ